jgi:hypothetical protein
MSVTLVSCYYKIKSKSSIENYRKWIDNFFTNIKSNLIIFTNKESRIYLETYLTDKVFIIEKDFEEFEIFKQYPNIWEQQYEMDCSKYCGRTKYCYMIWNSKINMVNEAIKINPFSSNKFIWNDIGNIRKQNIGIDLSKYPIYDKISNEKIDIAYLRPFNKNDMNRQYFKDEVHFSGSIIAGSIEIWKKFHKLYYDIFKKYIDNNQFIGCDQQIISSCYIENQEIFHLIYPIENKYDEWFYLYQYYS